MISRWIVANLVAEEPEAAITFPPPPRTVRRRSGWVSIIFVRLLALMFFLVWLLIVGSLVIDAVTRAFGRPVAAHLGVPYEKSAKEHRIMARYSFDAGGGRMLHRETEISRESLRNLTAGSTVPAKTLSIGVFHPSALMLGTRDYWSVQRGQYMMSVVWLVFLLLILHSAWTLPQRQRRLLREGEPVVAVVTRKRVSTGRSTSHYVRYDFTTADGEPFTAEQEIPKKSYTAIRIGQPIIAFFDPAVPKYSVAYDCCEFEIVS